MPIATVFVLKFKPARSFVILLCNKVHQMSFTLCLDIGVLAKLF